VYFVSFLLTRFLSYYNLFYVVETAVAKAQQRACFHGNACTSTEKDCFLFRPCRDVKSRASERVSPFPLLRRDRIPIVALRVVRGDGKGT
jgi:hypothetical protein